MKKLKYIFEEVQTCEMCGDSTKNHIILGQRLNQSQGIKPKSKTGISISVMKCKNCELIYSQPQPVPFDIQDHYGIPPEDYWKPEQFNYNSDYFSAEIKIVKELLPFKEGMTALDIGAGLGKCMTSLADAGFDAYGLEPSIPFYERALSKMKISPEKLKLGMVEGIDYEEQSFDFITYGAVFEHLYHPAQTLEKTLKWLKPSGIIHIEVPSSKHTIAKLINLYFKLIGTNYVTHISPMHTPFHLYEFGLKSFEELGKKISYRIAKQYYEVCDIYFAPEVFHPILRKYMKLNNTGMQLMVYLRKSDD
jgi:2-polyprenyl-3-methyl-5-hydroxy-6-metoxy-1,4-benzoquinol methylase